MKGMNPGNILIFVFIFVFMFAACGKNTENGIEPQSENTAVIEDDTEITTTDEVVDEPEEKTESDYHAPEQDLEKFPSKEEWEPLFPDYESNISWYQIPRTYIGGLGTGLEMIEDEKEYALIYERPSLSSKVIADLYYFFLSDPADCGWWMVNEFYHDAGDLYMGEYNVENEGYTWIPIQYIYDELPETIKDNPDINQEIRKGWIKIDVVEYFGI